MKNWMLLAVLLGAVCVSSALAKDKLSKKAHSDDHKKHIADIEAKLEHLLEIEEEIESEIALVEDEEMNLLGEEEDEDYEAEDEDLVDPDDYEEQPEVYEGDDDEDEQQPKISPCIETYCGAGRKCVVNDDLEAECLCVSACEDEIDPRRKVCSNLNETWPSDCELYRQRCLCEDEEPTCVKEDYNHMHIEYYGECQQFSECDEAELNDFPRRMNEWLFSVMRDMADRNVLSKHYLELEKEAEQDPTKQWTNAVVWKWCDLDSHPRDRAVSRHELFPIRAPLMALEHCIGTFLDSCDPNDDHFVTLKEWTACTKLSVEDLNKLDTLCEDLREE